MIVGRKTYCRGRVNETVFPSNTLVRHKQLFFEGVVEGEGNFLEYEIIFSSLKCA